MTTLTLRLDGTTAAPAPDPTALLPRRVRISRAGVERLAELTTTPLPWDHPRAPSPTERALGPMPGPQRDDVDADPELRRLGLLDAAGGLYPELPEALVAFADPDVLVDIDVSVRRPAASSALGQIQQIQQLHSWQRLRGDRVTALSTAGGLVELGWFGDALWQAELARAVSVTPPPTTAEVPTRLVDLPHELLLGTGEAIRLGRDDVFAELVGRHASQVRLEGPVSEQVRLLHTSSLGRMQTVVSGQGADGSRRIGWLSWSLYADGWRALTPYTRAGMAMVRIRPVEALQLGIEVARLATGVRG